jgi:hypothetical protein
MSFVLKALGIGALALLLGCDRGSGSTPKTKAIEPNEGSAATSTARSPAELELWLENGQAQSCVISSGDEIGITLHASRRDEFEGRRCAVQAFSVDDKTQWEWAVTNADINSGALQPENGRQTAHCVVVAYVPVVLSTRAGTVMRWDETGTVTRRTVEPGRCAFTLEPAETTMQPQ